MSRSLRPVPPAQKYQRLRPAGAVFVRGIASTGCAMLRIAPPVATTLGPVGAGMRRTDQARVVHHGVPSGFVPSGWVLLPLVGVAISPGGTIAGWVGAVTGAASTGAALVAVFAPCAGSCPFAA